MCYSDNKVAFVFGDVVHIPRARNIHIQHYRQCRSRSNRWRMPPMYTDARCNVRIMKVTRS